MTQINEFMAEVKQEGTDPFAALEKETPSESPAENTPEEKEEETPAEETPAEPAPEAEEEEQIPFHKHPRWIERENELKEERQAREELEAEIASIKARIDAPATGDSDIPDWFKELYGENQTAWTKYRQHEEARTLEIEKNIIARQEAAREQAAKEEKRWEGWVEEQMDALKEEGLTFDRNELAKIMLDYSPTDENNNLDFRKGYAIYEALKAKPEAPKQDAKSEARKMLADTTTSTTKGEPAKKDFMTPEDLRNRSWSSL